jgi:hypothetical protein
MIRYYGAYCRSATCSIQTITAGDLEATICASRTSTYSAPHKTAPTKQHTEVSPRSSPSDKSCLPIARRIRRSAVSSSRPSRRRFVYSRVAHSYSRTTLPESLSHRPRAPTSSILSAADTSHSPQMEKIHSQRPRHTLLGGTHGCISFLRA